MSYVSKSCNVWDLCIDCLCVQFVHLSQINETPYFVRVTKKWSVRIWSE